MTLNHTDIQARAHRLTLEADVESTVEVVMAVEASLTVVLESCSPVCLDIMRAPCGLDKKTHTARVNTPLSHLIEHLYISPGVGIYFYIYTGQYILLHIFIWGLGG